MSVTGVEDTIKELKAIDHKMANKYARRAVSKATGIVLKASKGKVLVQTKVLKKSLGRKTKTYRNSGVSVGVVGPRAGYRQTVQVRGRKMVRDPRKYAHLVETGHKGFTGTKFLKRSLRQSEAQCEVAMVGELRKGLESGG